MKRSVRLAGPPPRLGTRLVEREVYPGGLFRVGLEPEAGFAFRPGDCVGVYGSKGTISRPYSLSGGVGDEKLELLIRRIPGGQISEWLYTLVLGSRVEISPPFGWFHPGASEHPQQVWFATGSGIAPFLSAWRSGGVRPVQARWGVRSVQDLEGIDAPFEGFVSQGDCGKHRAGRVTDALDEITMGPEFHYYLCGLDAMIEEVAEGLLGKGIREEQIHRECFFQSQAR